MAKRKRKLDPNRFQKEDEGGLFSFGPIRRNLFKWGIVAGGIGGLFMLRQEVVWQIVGIFAVVFISNYHIIKASRRIPRWHATVISFLGVLIAMFGVIILGTLVVSYLQAGGISG